MAASVNLAFLLHRRVRDNGDLNAANIYVTDHAAARKRTCLHGNAFRYAVKVMPSLPARSTLRLAVCAIAASAYGLSMAHPCAGCHPKQVSGYARTGMARSLTSVSTAQPSGIFTHALSATKFNIRSTGEGMVQRIEQNGLAAEHQIAYVIGSGNHAFGYLVKVGRYLFQSPIAYYSKRDVWDMAPGYEHSSNPDFTRPVTAECVVCHSGVPRPVAKTLNAYEQPPFSEEAISCDRCHGDPAAHVQKPSTGNIVNPAKLPRAARDSVCEQCHLGGETRVLNPGRKFEDFRPGQVLEDVFSVYVSSGEGNGFKVVSHIEQLAISACARKSQGTLWCGTCHDPHEKPADAKDHYRAACVSCHSATLSKAHMLRPEDCTECHMPKRLAKDGGHSAFTDHRIVRVPRPEESPAGPLKIVAWRPVPDPLATRNLGIASVLVGVRDQSPTQINEGFGLLMQALKSYKDDPIVVTNLATVLLRRGAIAESAQLFEAAIKLDPGYAAFHVNYAQALKELGHTANAIAHLETAIELDPSLEAAYRTLGEIYAGSGQADKLRDTFERYLNFMPKSITARSAARTTQR